MNSYHLLTSPDHILRKFAKDRIEKNDLPKWKIIEYSNQIPDEFEFIIKLDLSYQKLKEIPLNTLFCLNLYCNSNQLVELPNLPFCKKLYCDANLLINLPNLPNCKILSCSFNKLIQVPDLPYCEVLNCSYNKLTKLPDLPYCELLNCSYNKLTKIPNIICGGFLYSLGNDNFI